MPTSNYHNSLHLSLLLSYSIFVLNFFILTLLFGDDFLGDFIKERFSLILQDSIDEISESPIGRAFTVHKVFIADIDFAIVLQLS